MTNPNDLIRRGEVEDLLDLAEHDAEERDWRSGANELARIRKYVNALPAAPVSPEVLALVEAAKALQSDMLERAECGIDVISGEQYRVVNAGNGAWVGFCAAIAAWEASHDR